MGQGPDRFIPIVTVLLVMAVNLHMGAQHIQKTGLTWGNCVIMPSLVHWLCIG